MATVNVQSPNIRYSEQAIEADYEYENVRCVKDEKSNSIKVGAPTAKGLSPLTASLLFPFW